MSPSPVSVHQWPAYIFFIPVGFGVLIILSYRGFSPAQCNVYLISIDNQNQSPQVSEISPEGIYSGLFQKRNPVIYRGLFGIVEARFGTSAESWPLALQAHLKYLAENEMIMCISRSGEIRKDLVEECSDYDGFPQALAKDGSKISEHLHDILRSDAMKAQVRAMDPEHSKGVMGVLAKELKTNASSLTAKGLWSSAQQLFVETSIVCGDVTKDLFVVGGIGNVTRQPQRRGGKADIYQGTFHGNNVALKVLRNLSKDGAQKELCQDAPTWKSLRSDHILLFLGIDEASFLPGSMGLVSPWMQNGNIINHLKSEEGSKHPVEKYLVEIAEGLRYLHSENVLHGDLRGANILIDENFTVKIADFGIVRFLERMENKIILSEGVARWIDPELLPYMEIRPTKESDIYSFGMVCFEIYTLKPPFAGLSDFVVFDLVFTKGERPQWPNETASERPLPSLEMKELIERCWSQDDSKRGSMDEVVRTLGALFEGDTGDIHNA